MNNKINYEIDNCTTDLDTLIALDKRAIRDLENNTHEIEQHEVLTIIREFIRLRNDYKQEKEKNKDLEIELDKTADLLNTCNKRLESISRELGLIDEHTYGYNYEEILEKIKEIKEDECGATKCQMIKAHYISKDKIKQEIKELENMQVGGEVFVTAVNFAIKILEELLEGK